MSSLPPEKMPMSDHSHHSDQDSSSKAQSTEKQDDSSKKSSIQHLTTFDPSATESQRPPKKQKPLGIFDPGLKHHRSKSGSTSIQDDANKKRKAEKSTKSKASQSIARKKAHKNPPKEAGTSQSTQHTPNIPSTEKVSNAPNPPTPSCEDQTTSKPNSDIGLESTDLNTPATKPTETTTIINKSVEATPTIAPPSLLIIPSNLCMYPSVKVFLRMRLIEETPLKQRRKKRSKKPVGTETLNDSSDDSSSLSSCPDLSITGLHDDLTGCETYDSTPINTFTLSKGNSYLISNEQYSQSDYDNKWNTKNTKAIAEMAKLLKLRNQGQLGVLGRYMKLPMSDFTNSHSRPEVVSFGSKSQQHGPKKTKCPNCYAIYYPCYGMDDNAETTNDLYEMFLEHFNENNTVKRVLSDQNTQVLLRKT